MSVLEGLQPNASRIIAGRRFGRRIIASLLLGFAVLAGTVATAGWLLLRAGEFGRSVDHSYTVQSRLGEFRANFERAEAARRGYLIAGGPRYADIYRQTSQNLGPRVREIRTLTTDNPIQQRRLDQLEPLLAEKLALLARSMEERREDGLAAAVAAFQSPREQALLDRIRAISDEMSTDERRLLVERSARETRNTRLLLGVVILAGVLLALLAAFSTGVMRRYTAELVGSETRLQRANEGLEAAVGERTADLSRAEAALRAANERLEAIVARQSALLREVNHRVANSLQLVASLVHMQASALRDEGAREALQDTQARIAAITQIHRRLYTSNDVEYVDMGDYLNGLVAELEQSVASAGQERPIRIEVEPVRLQTDKAVSLGVVVTELVTNALKYAYAPGEPGEVRIALRRQDGGPVMLVVEDDGRGMGAGAPNGTGLGQKVVAAMARSLDSRLENRSPPQGGAGGPGLPGLRAGRTVP